MANLTEQEDLTIWLPFTSSPTEDLCGSRWVQTDGSYISVLDSEIELADAPTDVALFLTGSTSIEPLYRLALNCQGMYLGGKDFSVEFDWWYGGSNDWESGEIFGFYDRNHSDNGSIYLRVDERYNPNYQHIQLVAFGQSNPSFKPNYREWWNIKIDYSHAESRLKFYFKGDLHDELEVTIPRTFFPHVEIGRPNQQRGTTTFGFISNFKVSGGELAGDCVENPNDPLRSCAQTIHLCVLRNGEVLPLPFRNCEVVNALTLAIRHDGRNWYNVLRNPTDSLASDFYILHNNTIYALTKGSLSEERRHRILREKSSGRFLIPKFVYEHPTLKMYGYQRIYDPYLSYAEQQLLGPSTNTQVIITNNMWESVTLSQDGKNYYCVPSVSFDFLLCVWQDDSIRVEDDIIYLNLAPPDIADLFEGKFAYRAYLILPV